MEDLNNHQLVLLTTLVAFVTSVATGIITVALLQEAPQTVTQTVNRVVERTVERVVTGTSTKESETKPTTITNEVTKEITVYAKEDDLLVSAVEKNQPRVAQIYPKYAATGTPAIGVGFVVARDGLVVTTNVNLLIDGVLLDGYKVEVNGERYNAKILEVKNVPSALAFLKLDLGDKKVIDAISFSAKFNAKVGQTVVALGGESGSGLFKTTLSRFVYERGEGTSTPQVLSGIEVTPKIPEGFNGALVANLDGFAVGMSVWNEEAKRYIILPAERIYDAMQAPQSGKEEVKKEVATAE